MKYAMTCAFMPDGATFNGIKNMLSDEQFARLHVGDLLNDELHIILILRLAVLLGTMFKLATI